MSDFFEKWRFGVVLLFMVSLFAIGVPAVVMGMVGVAVTLLGIDLANMHYLYTWILLFMGGLGPYFLGHGWNDLGEMIDKIKPGSIRNK